MSENELPPGFTSELPPGFTAQPPSKAGGSDLPPGFSAEPTKTKTPASMGVGPGGELIPTTPEELKSQIDISSGLLSGVAQSAVGVGQFLSDLGRKTPRGQAAEARPISEPAKQQQKDYLVELQRDLQKFGDPTAQTVGRGIGETGMLMLGGEALVGPKVVAELAPYAQRLSPLVPEFAKKGYQFLRGAPAAEAAVAETATAKNLDYIGQSIETLKQATKTTAKETATGLGTGTAVGGVAGATSGAISPRTEETTNARMAARWEEIKHGFETGAIVGGAVGVGGSLIGLLGEYGKKAWGQMTLSEQRAAVKKAEEALEKMRGNLQADVATTRAKKEVELEALEAAQGLRLTETETKALVESAQTRVDMAATEMENIITDFRNLPVENQKNFGNYVKDRLEKFKTKLEDDREIAAKFKNSLETAPKGAVVDVNPVVEYVDAKMGDYLEGSPTRTMLQNIKKSLVGETKTTATAEEAAEQLAKAQAAAEAGLPESGISVAQANNTRKEWNLMRSQRDLKALTGVDAVSQDQLHHLNEITNLLNKSAGEAHPPYMESVRTHAAMSRPLDPYRTGGFAKLGDVDMLSGENVKLGADVLRNVLAEARKGDPALAQLIKSDPEFKELAKQYFTGELFGVDLAKKNVTPAVFKNFFQKNKEVLDELGLTAEFAEMQKRFEAGKNVLEEAQTGLKGTEKKVSEITKETKQAASELEKTAKVQQSLHTLETEIKNAKPESVPEKYAGWAKSLREANVIDVPTYDKLLAGLRQAESDYVQTKDALKFAETVRKVVGGLGFAATAGSALTPYGVGSFVHKGARGGE